MPSIKKQDSNMVEPKLAMTEIPKDQAKTVDIYLELPKSYKKEYAAVFKTLPPEMRRYLHERESEVERGFSRVNNELNSRRWMDEVFGKRAERLCRCGINKPRDWVEAMACVDDALDSDPKAALQMLAQVYGCALNEPAKASAPNQALVVAELISRLERTEAALQELKTKFHDSHLQAQKLEEAKKAKDVSFAPHGKISKPDLSKLSTREVLELKMAEYE